MFSFDRMDKKTTWLDKLDDYAITHKEKLSGTVMTYTRHGYVPMQGDVVSDSVRDTHLCAYMQTLKEYSCWDKSLSPGMLFTITTEKHKGQIENGYRAEPRR